MLLAGNCRRPCREVADGTTSDEESRKCKGKEEMKQGKEDRKKSKEM
jgi:hypothetical protein